MGDELLASGEARLAQEHDPRRVQIVDRYGHRRWHALWGGNPRIAQAGEEGDFQTLRNAPGIRPYIASGSRYRWTWKPYQCAPGEIYFTPEEERFAANYSPGIVIEPTLKPGASPNKQWGGWARFVELATDAGYRLTQLGNTRSPNVDLIATPDFRHACAVLARADAYVGHEGGLHHAAAALGVPAVVIYGGFISPAQTGYADHRNLFTGGEPCGMRFPCKHCADAMAAITPERVLDELKGIAHVG